MIGFALSKLNLLILVTALFAIIVFFTYGLDEIGIGQQANRIARKTQQLVSGVIESDEVCAKRELSIPPSIKSLYSGSLYYVMNIRKNELPQKSQLIIEITRRPTKERKKQSVIASQKIELNGQIHIFDWDSLTNSLNEADKTVLDPQARLAEINDSLVIIKETYKGKKNIYIIPCTSHFSGSCLDREQTVGGIVKAMRGKPSDCIETEG